MLQAKLGRVLSNLVEELKDGHAKSRRNDFERVQRWIGHTPLKPAQVGLVKATVLSEHDLAQPALIAQPPHAGAQSLCQCSLHRSDYLGYALIHINTNSYNLGHCQ